MGSLLSHFDKPTSTSSNFTNYHFEFPQHIVRKETQHRMKAFLKVILLVALFLDLTTSFWIARSRLGGRNGRSRFGRFGRSDPNMENEVEEETDDYDYEAFLDNIADAIIENQYKRNVASLVRNRDLRNLSSMHGKRSMMNPLAKNKGLGK